MDQQQTYHTLSTTEEDPMHEDLLNQAFLASSNFSLSSQLSPCASFQISEVSSINDHQQFNFLSPMPDFHLTPFELSHRSSEGEWFKRKEQKGLTFTECKKSKKQRKQIKKEEKMRVWQHERDEDKQWLKKLLNEIDKFEYC